MSSSRSHRFSQEEVAAYERKRYRGLDQRLVDWREKKIVQHFLKLSLPRATTWPLALDAPCGYGRFSRLILDQGFRLVSGDFSPAMVERACRQGNNMNFPIGIVVDMKTRLPFKDDSFDVVVCLRFFHHLHTPEERKFVLAELGRVCRDKLIISFYHLQWVHRWQRAMRRLIHPSPTRISMLPLSGFIREAEEAGLEVKEIRFLCRLVHAQCLALLAKKSRV